jgi:hypothetical protein
MTRLRPSPPRLTARWPCWRARPSAKKEKKKEGEGEEAPDPVIKLQSMALPIIAGGKLINYVFLQMTITLKPEGVPVTVFEGKEPMLRDAIVREAHPSRSTSAPTAMSPSTRPG